MPAILPRSIPADACQALLDAGYSEPLARIFAARGILGGEELELGLQALLPPETLKGIGEITQRLAEAIAAQRNILVVADYDADGATACAVAVRGLRNLNARVDFLVPNRFEYGYGLTPEIVHLALQRTPRPDILLTVDNGIASVAGVAEANRLGLRVLVTDHHLPGEGLPAAEAIVNPNQPGCGFPSKHLAGVGVMFYVLLALRAYLRERGEFASRPEPRLGELLDLVALGTIADVVRLDRNNRILVEHGLRRIRAGLACPGIRALLQIARKSPARLSSLDLGFSIGPRLNAAGRLEDMSLGIQCLLSEDPIAAKKMAEQLDQLNKKRREIEGGMQDSALAILEHLDPQERYSLALFDPSWHQGVIGILASRLKEKFHRPVIAFAQAGDGELKGSGRSIPGLHLRDALDLISKRHPNLLGKFGGHAMAAGLSIAEDRLADFRDAFERVTRDLLRPEDLLHRLETDGSLATDIMTLMLAEQLEAYIWGQGFPPPEFSDEFSVTGQRPIGEEHLKLRLQKDDQQFDAVLFNQPESLPSRIRAVYSLSVNEYNDRRNLQLILRHWETLV
ncbi:MAG: single-stranded-DNA-specific exonuclease RecJ [Gallionella sp.]|nr:single-stranded-DNA-specific exonuclease RecJ [Gallionella sp.]